MKLKISSDLFRDIEEFLENKANLSLDSFLRIIFTKHYLPYEWKQYLIPALRNKELWDFEVPEITISIPEDLKEYLISLYAEKWFFHLQVLKDLCFQEFKEYFLFIENRFQSISDFKNKILEWTEKPSKHFEEDFKETLRMIIRYNLYSAFITTPMLIKSMRELKNSIYFDIKRAFKNIFNLIAGKPAKEKPRIL